MKRVNIRITDEMHDYVKQACEQMGIPMSAYMCMAINQYIQNEKVIKQIPTMTKLCEYMNMKQVD